MLCFAWPSIFLRVRPRGPWETARSILKSLSFVMSSLMFVFLSGRDKGKTRIYQQDRVSIGTSDACDLVVSFNGARATGKLFAPPEVLAHVKRVKESCQLVVKCGDDAPVAVNRS